MILRFPVKSGQDCTAPCCCTHGRGTLIRAGPNFCGTAYGDLGPDDPAGLPSFHRLVEEDSRSEHAQTPVCVRSSGSLDADLLPHLTEWPQFSHIAPHKLAARTATPKVIDGRGTLNTDTWRDAGWTVRALGRP